VNPKVVRSILLKGPGEGAREGLQRHLRDVECQVPLPLLDFALGGAFDNRSRVNETPRQGL